jgi:hypothetical protein
MLNFYSKKKYLYLFFLLTLLALLKVYYDLTISYPLTNAIYVNEDIMRSNTISNKIIMNNKSRAIVRNNVTASNDFFVMVSNISDYVRSKIKKGDSPGCDFSDWNDPITSRNETFGDCSGYAKLFVMLANEYDINARVVWLFGHVSAEAWNNEKSQWIAVDVQGNIFHTDDKGRYLNYIDIVKNPQNNIKSIQIGKETVNDPLIDLTDRKMNFVRMMVLDDETILNYCNMKSNTKKVFLSYLGLDSIGKSHIFSVRSNNIKHRVFYKF